MSIRRTNIDRINEALKSSKLTIGKGAPSKSEGSEGDLTFRRTSDGFKLFIKANNIWHSIKAGESFDKLEKIINDLKKKVDKIKPFNQQIIDANKGFKVGNTTITTSEYDVSSGNLTVDVAGDIALSAAGRNVTMDNGTTTTFDFNTNTSVLKIMDTANTDDYCTITVGAEGVTTIATNDDDTAVGHLLLDPDGDVKITGASLYLDDNERFYLDGNAGSPGSFISQTGDIIGFTVGGQTLFKIVEDATTSVQRSSSILTGCPIQIKDIAAAPDTPTSGWGSIYVNGDILYFINDSGTAKNITTQYHYQMHQWYSSRNDNCYIPFGASVSEFTSITDSYIDDLVWIAPFAGKLVEAKLYSDSDTGATDLKLDVNGSLGSSLMSGGAVNCSSDKTVYTFTCDQNNTFSAGNIISIFIEPTNAPAQITVSTKWEITG